MKPEREPIVLAESLERRRYTRTRAAFPVAVEPRTRGNGDAPTAGRVVDISEKGLLLELPKVPGSRDVINGLGVSPPAPDLDAEMTDAVRTALEKDVFVDASQIRIFSASSSSPYSLKTA